MLRTKEIARHTGVLDRCLPFFGDRGLKERTVTGQKRKHDCPFLSLWLNLWMASSWLFRDIREPKMLIIINQQRLAASHP